MIARLDADLPVVELGPGRLDRRLITGKAMCLVIGDASEEVQIDALQALAAAKVKHLCIKSGHRSIPAAIGEIRTLRGLHIVGREIASLPTAVGRLERLRTLRLEMFHLLALPRSIGRLRKLVALHVDSHHLSCFPRDLDRLHALEEIAERLYWTRH